MPGSTHGVLIEIVGNYVREDAVVGLLWGYRRRYVSDGAEYMDIRGSLWGVCYLR
jgi:hypothetical protein